MPITNAQAVRFSNEQLRVLANVVVQAYRTAWAVKENYYAAPELGAEYTTGIAELIVDNSANDGRPPVTGNDALGMITQSSDLITWLTENNNARLNVFLAYATNGQSWV